MGGGLGLSCHGYLQGPGVMLHGAYPLILHHIIPKLESLVMCLIIGYLTSPFHHIHVGVVV